MHRKPLRELLARHVERWPEDAARVAEILALVDAQPDCFERRCWAGHVTGSAWVATPDRRRALLVHHRKLGRWLQPGGHADGDGHIERVALREAMEETGLDDLALHVAEGGLVPLDVDIHPIPARGTEPAHFHHDVRFLVIATGELTPRASEESHAVRWFEVDRIREATDEQSVLRLARRALAF